MSHGLLGGLLDSPGGPATAAATATAASGAIVAPPTAASPTAAAAAASRPTPRRPGRTVLPPAFGDGGFRRRRTSVSRRTRRGGTTTTSPSSMTFWPGCTPSRLRRIPCGSTVTGTARGPSWGSAPRRSPDACDLQQPDARGGRHDLKFLTPGTGLRGHGIRRGARLAHSRRACRLPPRGNHEDLERRTRRYGGCALERPPDGPGATGDGKRRARPVPVRLRGRSQKDRGGSACPARRRGRHRARWGSRRPRPCRRLRRGAGAPGRTGRGRRRTRRWGKGVERPRGRLRGRWVAVARPRDEHSQQEADEPESQKLPGMPGPTFLDPEFAGTGPPDTIARLWYPRGCVGARGRDHHRRSRGRIDHLRRVSQNGTVRQGARRSASHLSSRQGSFSQVSTSAHPCHVPVTNRLPRNPIFAID